MATKKVKGKPLTDTQVKTLPAGPGGKAKYYSDTHGLYLIVRRPNSRDSRSFGFRGTLNGKQLQTLYLGSYPTKLSLEDARKERDRLNGLLKEGVDPRQERERKKNADTKPRTVNRLLDLYFKEKIERERGHDTEEKRRDRIKKALWHIRPISKAIGGMLVKDVEPHHLLLREHVGLGDLLDKSLNSGKERCRILRVSFRMAVTRKWIKRDDNPASDEFFDDLFEHRFHISKPADSIDYVDAPRLVAAVKGYKNKGLGKSDHPMVTVPPLLFLIYTGVRTKEVRYAKWGEIRWNERLWEVPPENRKTGHLKHGAIRAIPISEAMLKVLNKMKARYPGEPPPDDLIFPGGSKFGGVARGSINAFIKGSLKWDVQVSPHGFRATLKAWARAQSPPYEMIYVERQFDHVVRGLEVAAELMKPSAGVAGYDDHNRPGMTDPTIGRRREMTEKYGEYLESYKAPEIADATIVHPAHQEESVTL